MVDFRWLLRGSGLRVMAMFKYKHVRVPTGTQTVSPNYAKKNGSPEGDPFFLFLLNT